MDSKTSTAGQGDKLRWTKHELETMGLTAFHIDRAKAALGIEPVYSRLVRPGARSAALHATFTAEQVMQIRAYVAEQKDLQKKAKSERARVLFSKGGVEKRKHRSLRQQIVTSLRKIEAALGISPTFDPVSKPNGSFTQEPLSPEQQFEDGMSS